MAGVSDAVIETALPDTLKPIPRVLELDRKQPEGTRTMAAYLQDVVNKQRVKTGQSLMMKHKTLLKAVSEKYGVEPEFIVALWGIETSFGKNTGGYQLVPALATLAFDGRREAFFRDELIKALKIVDEDHIKLEDMRGSWAGAMGQIQFMPSSFFKFAVDHDGDGRRDIWGTTGDVFASAANYLSQSGWQHGQIWGHAVTVPKNIDRSLLTLDKTLTLQEWYNLGVRQPNGKGLSYHGAHQASVIQPDGEGTQGYIVYGNYRVILKWNKSKYFATAVGLLADKLRGW